LPQVTLWQFQIGSKTATSTLNAVQEAMARIVLIRFSTRLLLSACATRFEHRQESVPAFPREHTNMAISNAAHELKEEYMEINTRYGKQVVEKASLIDFPDGLPGFEDLHQYKLFHEEGKSTIYYLQSTEDADIRLPLITPEACKVDFRIDLSDEEVSKLQIESENDLVVVITLSDNQDNVETGITANFMAPIIINAQSRIGIQKTLNQVNGGVMIQAQ
jgi:flagellar assembly factor FliW